MGKKCSVYWLLLLLLLLLLFQFEKEIFAIIGSSWRLKECDQVVAISRTMLQAETPSQRTMLLQVRGWG